MKRLPTLRPNPRVVPALHVPALASVTVERVPSAAREGAEQSLRESEARYHLLADHGADMIVCTRPDRTRSYVSPASRRLVGYEPAELVDLDFAISIHPDDRQRVKTEYEQFLKRGGAGVHTYRMRRKDGSYVWVDVHWVTIFAGPLAHTTPTGAVVAVVRDVSERKAAESTIASMASHDTLTGLPNRVMLRERLKQAEAIVHAGGSVAVLSVGLDNFKTVNDTLGHAAGDVLLKTVAERLLPCVREIDTVARFGGDEFVVVLLGLDQPGEAAARGKRIVDALGAPYHFDGHELLVSASVGIAMSPQDGMLPDDLLTHADEALTCAKAEGGGAYREFQPQMAVHRQARLDTEADLRLALADEAFRVFYQPVVNLTSDTIVGFEALVRWQHPARGLVTPDAFIPLAEETGLIVPLGAWILRQACRDAARWPRAIRVSVNVSSIQFVSANFVDTVRSALHDSGLPARRLDLEITESVLLRESPGTVATLKELRRLGIGISLDDFGTGFASLGYLRSFTFDRIKIDRSFVGDLLQRAESEAIVRAVVGIGAMLGIGTVAEGVETRGQLQRLRAHGCSEAQGYYFSKAMPAGEVAAMLAAFDAPHRHAKSLAFA